jgi:hypothetical protein
MYERGLIKPRGRIGAQPLDEVAARVPIQLCAARTADLDDLLLDQRCGVQRGGPGGLIGDAVAGVAQDLHQTSPTSLQLYRGRQEPPHLFKIRAARFDRCRPHSRVALAHRLVDVYGCLLSTFLGNRDRDRGGRRLRADLPEPAFGLEHLDSDRGPVAGRSGGDPGGNLGRMRSMQPIDRDAKLGTFGGERGRPNALHLAQRLARPVEPPLTLPQPFDRLRQRRPRGRQRGLGIGGFGFRRHRIRSLASVNKKGTYAVDLDLAMLRSHH